MNVTDYCIPPNRVGSKRAATVVGRRATRQLDYRIWREDEIVRLELMITQSVMARARLLRVYRTAHVQSLLHANERRLLRLGVAVATLTSIPFSLADMLLAAATVPRFSVID